MGNLNCIPCRRGARERRRSHRVRPCYQGDDGIVADSECNQRNAEMGVRSTRGDDTGADHDDNYDDETCTILESQSRISDVGNPRSEPDDAVVNVDDGNTLKDHADNDTEEAKEDIESKSEKESLILEKVINNENDWRDNTDGDLHTTPEKAFKDSEYVDRAVESSRSSSAASGGQCCFEDEIIDPNEAGLIAYGIRDVNLITRDMIGFLVAVNIKPRIKAIDRIRSDDATTSWRSDPIPDEERRGSIEDLRWSRHMRITGGHLHGGSWESEELQRQNVTHPTSENRRFSKSTDFDEESDCHSKHRVTHSFKTQADDMSDVEREGRERGEED